MKRIAVYPGTFDPITNGHVDVMERAAKLFDQLIVAIAKSARKTPYFSLSERLSMTSDSLAQLNNVEVVSFEGLLVDFARAHQATFILRGLRAVSDFDYEFQLAGMNRAMAAEIETIFLPATEETANISATMVREIMSLGGDVSPFVPPKVVERLKEQ